MTPLFPTGTAKSPQAIALAFAVASLQSQSSDSGDNFPPIPAALLEVPNAFRERNLKTRKNNEESDPKRNVSMDENRIFVHEEEEEDDDDDDEDGLEDFCDSAGGPDNENDSERRLARSRERNREHARRTRLRKKAQLEALQSKVRGLEAERQVLKQKVEECGIASILLGLSSGSEEQFPLKEQQNDDSRGIDSSASLSETAVMSDASSTPNMRESPSVDSCDNHNSSKSVEDDLPSPDVNSSNTASLNKNDNHPRCSELIAALSGAKRKRFISEAIGEPPTQQRLTIHVDGHTTIIGAGKSHINWKTGVYRDQQGVQRQLTTDQLEDLRRERNRMHAKMTRCRKKCFVATIEKAIHELETENHRMREILEKVAARSIITPATSPGLSPLRDHGDLIQHPRKRANHGFRLDD